MIGIFLSCIIVSFTLIVYGKILLNFFEKTKFYLNENFSEYGLFGIIFFRFLILSEVNSGTEKNRSDSEINASPEGKNERSLLISVDSFRLNCF